MTKNENKQKPVVGSETRHIEELESRLSTVIELSSEFYWELDTDYRLTQVEGARMEEAGYSAEALIGRRHWEIATVSPVSDGGSWDGFKAALDERRPFADFIYKHLSLDGDLRYVITSGQPIFDRQKRFTGYRGITRDITHRVLIERRIAVESAANRILAGADSIPGTIANLLKALGETLGWACAAYWRVDGDSGELYCSETWSGDEERYRKFSRASREFGPLSLENNDPLGAACKTAQPVSIRNVTKDPSFRRHDAAVAASLRNAMAIPVHIHDEPVGVLEFFSPEAGHQADEKLLQSAAQIGTSLSQFILRKRAEDEANRLYMATDLSPDMIYLVDPEALRFLYVNETACRVTGLSREEHLKISPTDITALNHEQLRKLYKDVIAAGAKGVTTEALGMAPDGRRGYFQTTRRALHVGDQWIIASISRDVTDRRIAERNATQQSRMFAALSDTNEAILHATTPVELYRKVCNAAVEGERFPVAAILLPDARNNHLKTVAAAGVRADSVRDMSIAIGAGAGDRDLIADAWESRRPEVVVTPESAGSSGNDTGILARAAIPLVRGDTIAGMLLLHADNKRAFDDETMKLLMRMAENIAFALDNFERENERRRSQERIQYLATHDGLTGLPNRLMFNELLDQAIASAKRFGRRFAVLFIDLDRFKLINDTLGHQAGDELLVEMSTRLRGCLRGSDVVARLGGDEFVILLAEISNKNQVAVVGRKILAATLEPLEIMGQDCRVTASIGIAQFPEDAGDEQTLMKNADLAMYLAKEEGKNNFQFYNRDIKTKSLERMTLETHLRGGLEREEFTLHYQAKRDLQSGAIMGVEALLRWQSPELGAVSPTQFIPVAEETGLIIPIGRWVLKTACEQSMAWQEEGLDPLCIAVNLSPRQFNDTDLLKDIAEALSRSCMPAELLELEITEGMVMHNTERTVSLLKSIKRMGVKVAIDNFGTGYSSLAQLKRFPIDTLKVDRSFIRDVTGVPGDMSITEAVIAMGKKLSLTIVAEGVETREQEAFLRERACDQMQGYYFCKPMAADKFAVLLRGQVPEELESE